MKYDYDLIVIGLGPGGMAVSIMASEMGLKVCAIEKNKVGGECMNVGCIPSKSLLRMAKHRNAFDKLSRMGLLESPKPAVNRSFEIIQEHLKYISEKKTMKMFDKVKMVYQKGAAEFIDPHTVKVGNEKYSAKRIFICVGTRPAVPDFPGIADVDYLTNENMFSLDHIPESMIVTGGGAIACEMAQAFSRLGSKVTVIIRGPRLMWREDRDATDILESVFEEEGITILREQKPSKFELQDGNVVMHTDKGQTITAQKVLVAAGREYSFQDLKLENAGVKVNKKGAIEVNKYLQTSQRHIFAPGDCNGNFLFSHAAMHQGMLAIINSMMPGPFKRNFHKYTVPWTVFTEPQISRAGMNEKEIKDKGIKYEVIKVNYADYGAAIAEAVDTGFVKAFVSPSGRIYGVYIVGEGSGEMINEWSLAIQNNLRMHNIMMLQHSFPTMGFLTKRVSETWMMNKMKSKALQKICKFMFRRT
ncbi:MAG: dihydrolipoyl dehydrogenase family protein [Planctomycetota bacterium]|jgi:pyruvate/2-oxoglutarate dehydrogenase complex dihydrolipoamide dehydrogenase (E3) component